MRKYLLSKSTFIKGLQCHKALYLNKYYKQLKAPVSPQLQAVFKRGTNVGLMAQKLFPGGIDASPKKRFDFSESVEKTRNLIESGTEVIYEAAFIFDDVLVLLDILVKKNGKWHCFEVKSSSSVSEVYFTDAAIQHYVISNCGLEIEDFSIVHLNKKYTRKGELEIDELFTKKSVINNIEKRQAGFRDEIDEMKAVLAGNEIPEVNIGPQCHNPYDCDFISYCWRDVPGNSVFEISGMDKQRQFELFNQGIKSINDISTEETHLSENQKLQVTSSQTGEPIINKKALNKFLETLQYPLLFLDFETFMPAIPIFDNCRPYEQIPFQYSMHACEEENGKVEHFEFIAEPGLDPRKPFLESLLEHTQGEGHILVYNRHFENRILKLLKQLFPEYKNEIEDRQNRLMDLMLPFKNKALYYPSMKGSYSIKNVLPAVVPGLNYQDLEVSDGQLASIQFEMLQKENDLFKMSEMREQLLEYCKRDTYAMVRLLEELYKIVED